jgi:3'-phosphoadenosine 5'-phosphosulfate sulfotransferase (PAPS reductase)/FAD synthetase/Fe-S-cluster-containing dehydrogenase component
MNDVDLISKAAVQIIGRLGGNNPAVSFSGGKDSLVALDLSVRAGVKKAVFVDTTVEFEDTVKYVETIRRLYKIDLSVVRPPKTFFELIDTFGFPSRRSRWCCEALKFGPLGRYALQNGITSFVTGLRSEESKKRRGYHIVGQNPMLPVKQINPILKWTANDVWAYLKEASLPINPLYSQGMMRIGCWPCPFKGKYDWTLTRKKFPDLTYLLDAKIRKICKDFSVGIKDIDNFVEEMAWTSHLFAQTSKIAGELSLGSNLLTITLNSETDMVKTLKLIAIVSSDPRIEGNKLTLSDSLESKKVKIVVEKAINCIGCGACLSICQNDALSLEKGSILVNIGKCNKCHDCIDTSKLRGACLRRNYAPVRYQLATDITEKNEDLTEERLSTLCSASELVGQIRSRVPIHETMRKILAHGKARRLGNAVIVHNELFTAVFRQNKNFLEVRFRTNEDSFSATVEAIRKFMRTDACAMG